MDTVTPLNSGFRPLAALGPIATACGCAAGLVYVYASDPSSGRSWFPPCPLHASTGLWCPGCGVTRATHMLLHGDLAGAFSANALFPGFFFLMAVAWLTWFLPTVGRRPPQLMWRIPTWAYAAFGAVMVAFGVLRNVPYGPFRALAP